MPVTGLDKIMEWLRQAVASGAHPRRIQMGSSPFPLLPIKKHPIRGAFLLVPVTGLEPVRCRQRRILSPLRLPFHHTGKCA